MPYESARARLPDVDEALWLTERGNLQTLADVARGQQVVAGPVAPVIEDAAFLSAATDKLPAEPWNASTWKSWTGGLASSLGRKGRALFHPLRLALTAQENGPEMAKLCR